MKKEILGLGPFLKEAEKRIDGLSKEEIKAILLMKAKNLKPTEREFFLAGLTPRKKAEVVIDDDTLLSEIDDFVKRIEDGEYSTGWGWDDEIHDEREWGDESWAEDMDELFDRAGELFLSGDMKLASLAYGKLLKAFHMHEETGHFPGQLAPTEMVETDLDEAKTRYLRALYETNDKKERAKIIFEEIEDLRYVGSSDFDIKTVEDALTTKPEDWRQFLEDMKGILLESVLAQNMRVLGYVKNLDMLCSIIFELEGLGGLSRLAKEHGNKLHKVYLVWISKLQEAGKDREAVEAYQQSLNVIPPQTHIRAEISDLAALSAKKIKDENVFFEMHKEAFFSSPDIGRLLSLRESAMSSGQLKVMEDVVSFLEEHQGKHSFISNPKELLVQAYILIENYEKMWDVTSKGEPLGWSGSNSSQAGAVPFLMVSSVRGIPLKSDSVIIKVWRGKEGYEDEQSKRFKAVVEKDILGKDISGEERIKQIKWATSIVEKRVDAIVSNKYRGSYDKAALLLVGCVEALNLLDRSIEAQTFFEKIRLRYNRHSAFQQEIRRLLK
jgi:tetratricopeptide (TPR) repeat protein